MTKPAVCAVLLVVAGCTTDGNAPWKVRESVEQIAVTHAQPGQSLTLVSSTGTVVESAVADALGSYLFRKVPAGTGYRVESDGGKTVSRHLRVKSVGESLPDRGFYSGQKLQAGFNYLTTRDGTTLSAYVTMPGPAEMGPYPTVVSYSGYDPSRPGEHHPQYEFLCDSLPALCDSPTDPGALVAALFGYATVGVNVRGTGCSGGAYDFFEPLQLLDGYDVIETVAAQPWVAGHQVGMVGLSYPGITQLFVASTQPPSLSAITPLSVIGNTATTLLPGGILNDGFALTWVNEVLDRAKPYGQGWEQGRVDGGDTQCAENQLLHGQLLDNVQMARDAQYYDPKLYDRLNPTTFADKISVPVFLGGSWQDEQTGPFFFTLLDKFQDAPSTRFHVYNGVHPDGFQPEVMSEWQAFLEMFVANRVPIDTPLVRDASPILFQQIFQSSQRLPNSRWTGYGSLNDARAAWQAEPPLHALFESGAGDPAQPGAPKSTFEHDFAAWPPPEQRAQRWFLGKGGTLAGAAPTDEEASSTFSLDPAAGERGILAPNGNVWDLLPAYAWQAPQAGLAAVFESPALEQPLTMFGTGSVDLWIKSTVDDADLQVTLSEIRPDGQEMYVQSGWLRASRRALTPDSTELYPAPTLTKDDEKALVPGEWTQARVGFAGFQHVFRAGSRLRLIIDTPGGSRAAWRFQLKQFATPAMHTIGHDAVHPSSLVLPIVDGVTPPATYPACPSLRGQPCRAWQPFTNQ
jgi:predicted acyl esterase